MNNKSAYSVFLKLIKNINKYITNKFSIRFIKFIVFQKN